MQKEEKGMKKEGAWKKEGGREREREFLPSRDENEGTDPGVLLQESLAPFLFPRFVKKKIYIYTEIGVG